MLNKWKRRQHQPPHVPVDQGDSNVKKSKRALPSRQEHKVSALRVFIEVCYMLLHIAMHRVRACEPQGKGLQQPLLECSSHQWPRKRRRRRTRRARRKRGQLQRRTRRRSKAPPVIRTTARRHYRRWDPLVLVSQGRACLGGADVLVNLTA